VSSITRRDFLKTLPAAAAGTRLMFAKAASKVEPNRILLGTGGKDSKGIYIADWNAATGELGNITLAAEVSSPSFLAVYPQGAERLVYAVSETGGTDSKLTAYRIAPGQTELAKINDVPSNGGDPTHIAVTRDGRTVVCANYGGGSVSSYHVRPDGGLSDFVSHFQFTGSGPYKGRQEGPHTHSANPTPDGKWVLVNDLGIDRIFIYRLNPATSAMTPSDMPFWPAKPGSGPRHMAFHPNGRWVYSVNELTSTVDILRWNSDAGTLTQAGSVSTLKEGFPENTAFAGEILCSQNGRQVYVGNRVADDTIAVFDVDEKTGLLKLIQLAENSGKNPRHIAIDPSGRWIVVSDVGTGDVVVLERDLKTGRLSETKHSYKLPSVEFAGFI
jgi:6-phosphogluconolactonase